MYRSTLFSALPITLLFFTTSASAASFDCKLAKSPREHAVCTSPELSAKDSQLSAAYTHLRARLSPAAAAEVQADQRSWLAYLDRACPLHPQGEDVPKIADCLADEYARRLDDLKPQPALTGAGNTLYTHHVSVLAPGERNVNIPSDPGFGTGSFSMPQIDNPNPQQQAFNTAIIKAVLNQSSNDPKKPAASFQAVTDGDTAIQLTYTVSGQNTRLLVVNLEIFEMGYGAAHPSTRDFTFTWWLQAGHELQTSDVFRPDSAWQTALAAAAVTKLHADKDRIRYYWTGAELARGISDGLKSPRQWTLSGDGLTITYGQYQVAAYVAGMPSVHFSWNELTPYLNPALHPETLPMVKPPTD